jgi:hypothetical protein
MSFPFHRGTLLLELLAAKSLCMKLERYDYSRLYSPVLLSFLLADLLSLSLAGELIR